MFTLIVLCALRDRNKTIAEKEKSNRRRSTDVWQIEKKSVKRNWGWKLEICVMWFEFHSSIFFPFLRFSKTVVCCHRLKCFFTVRHCRLLAFCHLKADGRCVFVNLKVFFFFHGNDEIAYVWQTKRLSLVPSNTQNNIDVLFRWQFNGRTNTLFVFFSTHSDFFLIRAFFLFQPRFLIGWRAYHSRIERIDCSRHLSNCYSDEIFIIIFSN